MNVVIDWQGGVPEPLESIYSVMAGDGAAVLRAARMLWGDEVVDRLLVEGGKKAGRVEEMLDGGDPLERIEERLEALISGPGQRSPTSGSADEVNSLEAADRLGVHPDTLKKLVRAGVLGRRNASPPGSGKPRYRYRVADIDRIKREGYHLLVRPPVPAPRKGTPKRPQAGFTSKHLDLE